MRAAVEGRATSGARKLEHQRIRTAEETFTDLKPLFGAAGITRVADVTGLDVLGHSNRHGREAEFPRDLGRTGKRSGHLGGTDIRNNGALEKLRRREAGLACSPPHMARAQRIRRRRRSERAAKSRVVARSTRMSGCPGSRQTTCSAARRRLFRSNWFIPRSSSRCRPGPALSF